MAEGIEVQVKEDGPSYMGQTIETQTFLTWEERQEIVERFPGYVVPALVPRWDRYVMIHPV